MSTYLNSANFAVRAATSAEINNGIILERKLMAMMLLLIAIMYLCVIFLVTARARVQAFSASFMEGFDSIHAAEVGGGQAVSAPKYGYPDTGNGYFGMRLPYKDWIAMNNGQRVQHNFLERVTVAVIGCLVGSVYYPWIGFGFMTTWFVARFAYTMGYIFLGANGRVIGSLLMLVAELGSAVLAILSTIMLVMPDAEVAPLATTP